MKFRNGKGKQKLTNFVRLNQYTENTSINAICELTNRLNVVALGNGQKTLDLLRTEDMSWKCNELI